MASLAACGIERAAEPEIATTRDSVRLHWTAPEVHPRSFPGTPVGLVLLTDASGLHVVAVAWDGSTFTDVFVSSRRGNFWSEFRNVSASALQSTRPAGVIADGSMHVIWGERTVPHRFDSRPDAVVYSSNRDATWSSPLTIFYNPRHVFQQTPAIAVDDAGNVHVFIGTRDTTTNRPVVVAARRAAGEWAAPQIATSAGLQPSAANVNGRLVVAYLRPAMPVGGNVDVNSVFAIRSNDYGVTWRDSVLVSRSGATPASDPVLIAAGDEVHLFWLQDRTGDIDAEAIMHSQSRDGVAWSRPRVAAEPGPGIQSWAVVADRFGRLHLLYQHSAGGGFPPSGPMRGFYAQLAGENWSVPVQLFDWERLGPKMAAAVSPLDSLYVAVTMMDSATSGTLYTASAYVGDPRR